MTEVGFNWENTVKIWLNLHKNYLVAKWWLNCSLMISTLTLTSLGMKIKDDKTSNYTTI